MILLYLFDRTEETSFFFFYLPPCYPLATPLLRYIMQETIKNINRSKKLPLGKLPLGNMLYICAVKPLL